MFGTCTKYNRTTHVGWILPDNADAENLPDFFVIPAFIDADKHHKYLMAGWRVEFTPFEPEGRAQAHNVKIISKTIAVQRSAPPTGGVK